MDSKVNLIHAEFQKEIADMLTVAIADLTHELEIVDIELMHESIS